MSDTNLKLGTRDWIWLITIVVSACISMVIMQYQAKADMTDRIISLDEKWQNRTENILKDIQNEIKEIRMVVPSTEFVTENRARIVSLEKQANSLEQRIIILEQKK